MKIVIRRCILRSAFKKRRISGRKAERFYDWADAPEDADFAIVFMESPLSDGYTEETGYRPVTLQYRPYTADTARRHSIGQGDFREREQPDHR